MSYVCMSQNRKLMSTACDRPLGETKVKFAFGSKWVVAVFVHIICVQRKLRCQVKILLLQYSVIQLCSRHRIVL